MKSLLVIWQVAFTTVLFAQSNFSYTPEHPKAGDLITFTYEPAGVLAGNLKFVNASYNAVGTNSIYDDVVLKRVGKKFIGTVQTDTAHTAVFFGFSIDDQFDNNFNNGYYILLNDQDGQTRRGAYQSLSSFYQYNSMGVDRDRVKSLVAMEKEYQLYPSEKKKYLYGYARLLMLVKPNEAPAFIQTEIEALLKEGLKAEDGYQMLGLLYDAANLSEQSKWIAAIKKEKFPNGKWKIDEFIQSFFREKDDQKALSMLADLEKNVASNPDWAYLSLSLEYHRLRPLRVLYDNKQWDELEKALTNISMNSEIADLYNSIAWELQKTSTRLPFAENVSAKATNYAKAQLTNPTGKKPDYLTSSQWAETRKYTYAQFADTYGMVLYRKGEYKKGFALMQEVVKLGKRKNAEHNNTYALLAAKVLKPHQYKTEMENFVKEAKATGEMTESLKALFASDRGSAEGFDKYLDGLKKEAFEKLKHELRNKMINQAAPSFTLKDLNGSIISLAELKGKTVVVDFWATWCGPCIASFPGMQKAVEQHKNDGNVKFVFIDTWESGDDRFEKVSSFIKSNNYSFQVLMDEDNKTVEKFNVEGIPTKFIVDPGGNIRFKSVGFGGSEDQLLLELAAMIELVAETGKKTL